MNVTRSFKLLLSLLLLLALNVGATAPAWAQESEAPSHAVSAANEPRSGFSPTELAIIGEVRAIKSGPLFAGFKKAFTEGRPKEWKAGERTILVESAAPFSGFTLMGENGFVLGKEAFVSDAELTKTLLHEIYRLDHSQARTHGVSGEQATSETQAAFGFSQRAYPEIDQPRSNP